jgi:hypothetical protein
VPNDAEPRIRVGVGGWTYEPWRGTFYPQGLTQKRELEFASTRLTSVEINGTCCGSLPATMPRAVTLGPRSSRRVTERSSRRVTSTI